MDKESVIKYAEQITGTYSREELGFLYDLASQTLKGDFIVEVGVEYGRSSSVLLHLAKDIGLSTFLVDARLWNAKEGEESTERILRDIGWRPMATAVSLLGEPSLSLWIQQSEPVGDTPVLIYPGQSSDAAKLFSLEFMATFVHIDGDHTRTGVLNDWAWLDLVADGGIIAWHDYDRKTADGATPCFPGYTEAIDEIMEGWEPLGVVGTLAAFSKPARSEKMN